MSGPAATRNRLTARGELVAVITATAVTVALALLVCPLIAAWIVGVPR